MFKEKNNKLENVFEFKNFSQALDFVNKVGNIAETIGHHPDIKIFNYKFVEISLFTHDENKITKKDYYLAELINGIKEFPKKSTKEKNNIFCFPSSG